MTLNPDQLDRVAGLIRRKTGMVIDSNKRLLLEKHIHDRLDALQISSLEEYCEKLNAATNAGHGWPSAECDRDVGHSAADGELEELINAVLINETLFFRNQPQMKILMTEIFPRMIRQRLSAGSNADPIRVWSAGCSTGAEPFSIVMAYEEACRSVGPKTGAVDIAVLATDISTKALKTASQGIYHSRPVEYAPAPIIQQYFVREPERDARGVRYYRVQDEIRKRVRFQTHNLTDQVYPGGFDLIFCRNVLIYLNEDVREHMTKRFYQSLKNGGILVVGHSENLLAWPEQFQAHFKGDAIYYEKRFSPLPPSAGEGQGEGGGMRVEKPPSPGILSLRSAGVELHRPGMELDTKEDEICLTLTGCLDADLYPHFPEELKQKLAGIVQAGVRDAGTWGTGGADPDGRNVVRAMRIHLKDVTYVSPEIPPILRRGSMLAGDRHIQYTIQVQDRKIGQFLERHGVEIKYD